MPETPSPAALLPAVSDSLPVRLLRAREAVMQRVRPILRAHDVTEQQWRVLRMVRDLKETEVTVLAGEAFLLAPSLSRILRDLAARGLLTRRSADGDQRRSVVSLTDEGRALIARAEPELSEASVEVHSLFGAERLDALKRLLTELESALALPDRTGEAL